uniref:Uncharacterized protein n=1 Tax=Arundo donax TaxID=35708 RepID=A0A0A9BA23_ARUDO
MCTPSCSYCCVSHHFGCLTLQRSTSTTTFLVMSSVLRASCCASLACCTGVSGGSR